MPEVRIRDSVSGEERKRTEDALGRFMCKIIRRLQGLAGLGLRDQHLAGEFRLVVSTEDMRLLSKNLEVT